MKPIYAHAAGAVALTFAIAACTPAPESTPAPAPTPVATVPPAPAPTPQPGAAYESWADVPATKGQWSYRPQNDGSHASFLDDTGRELFRLTCQRNFDAVNATRFGVVDVAMTIRTETRSESLRVPPSAGVPNTTTVVVRTASPLLDAMALTRGRFAVEVSRAPTLYLPNWADVARVIEDCR